MIINKYYIFKLICFFLMFIASLELMADNIKKQSPIRIQADSAEVNDKNKTSIYRGDVIITQSNMKLTGDIVTLFLNSNNEIKVAISEGNLAYFEQESAEDNSLTQAYGKIIKYNVEKNVVTIEKNGKIIQGANTFTGEKITYNTLEEKIIAGDTNQQKSNNDSRINMIITPKDEDKE